jgi:glycogen phosphorylase
VKDNFKWAREMAAWKFRVSSVWDKINIKHTESADGIKEVMKVGQEYPFRIELDLKGLSCHEVGLELIITENGINEAPRIVDVFDFEVEKCDDTTCCFKMNFHPVHPGSFNYGLRLYPKNERLPHRQDFSYVKWL